MKNIFKLLEEIGLEVPEDKKKDFEKAVNENYKTINEYNKVNEKLSTKSTELSTAQETINNLEEDLKNTDVNSKELETLRGTVKSYKQAEKKREEEAKRAQADKELTDIVLKAIGETEFVNEYTKKSIVNEIKTRMETEKGKGAKELFDEITKDQNGILKNPQQEDIKIPPADPNGGGGTLTLADIEKMSTDEINANWDKVSKVLAGGK